MIFLVHTLTVTLKAGVQIVKPHLIIIILKLPFRVKVRCEEIFQQQTDQLRNQLS